MANGAVRRIMAEVREFSTLNSAPSSFFYAAPLESDLFEWHFSVRGPPDTPFHYGVYHGRILLPAEYPLKPPEIILLTPNGRFEVGKRICLSVTAHHQETWQPSWGIRTILTALVGFMPSKAEGVGALDYPDDVRRGLARKSWSFRCPRCGVRPIDHLPPRQTPEGGLSNLGNAENGSTQQLTEEAPENGRSKPDNTENTEPNGTTVVNEASEAATTEADTSEAEGQESDTATDISSDTGEEDTEIALEAYQEITQVRDDAVGSDAVDNNVVGSDVAVDDAVPVLSGVEEDVVTPQADPASERGVVAGSNSSETTTQTGADTAEKARESIQEEVQEKELLYVAYAIVVLMVVVILRRVMDTFAS